MKETLLILDMIVAILLTGAILLQPSEGAGFGAGMGLGGEHFHTKRGVEKVLFGFTIVGIVLFVILSVLNVLFIA